MAKTFKNPILPGFYPDPSICRVGDDYYLVTSTFAYFPGVPIFHSKDLVHWEQIGNILVDSKALPLQGAQVSEGIFAPTLRYHDSTYYMITTNVSSRLGNFIMKAKAPEGPWEGPFPLGSEGIDPSLFFDDDGTCWYCGTQPRREGSKYFGDNEIYVQQLDTDSMKLVGESYPIWHGALREVEWPEGPHIYKKDGYYYLLISEAGTAHNHAVSIARGTDITKPFEGCRYNPILSHRHLGQDYPIVNVGHPDIVETKNGEWWMVLLASRPYGGYRRNLGRETFLVPFTWENGWPIINPGLGIVREIENAPDLEPFFAPDVPQIEDFDNPTLPMHMMYLRNPISDNYSYNRKKSNLSLRAYSDDIASKGNPSFVCIRQRHMDFLFETAMEFIPVNAGDEAGIVIFQSEDMNYQLLLGKDTSVDADNSYKITLYCVNKGEKSEVASLSCGDDNSPTLRLIADGQDLYFYYINKKKEVIAVNETACDGRILCTDLAGGFVGTTMGIYAHSDSDSSDNFAHFDYIKYIGN